MLGRLFLVWEEILKRDGDWRDMARVRLSLIQTICSFLIVSVNRAWPNVVLMLLGIDCGMTGIC